MQVQPLPCYVLPYVTWSATDRPDLETRLVHGTDACAVEALGSCPLFRLDSAAMCNSNIEIGLEQKWNLAVALKRWNLQVLYIQWNLGCQKTLISNKSVPEHKTKTKNGPVPEQANW
jgi:hypothetical protein